MVFHHWATHIKVVQTVSYLSNSIVHWSWRKKSFDIFPSVNSLFLHHHEDVQHYRHCEVQLLGSAQCYHVCQKVVKNTNQVSSQETEIVSLLTVQLRKLKCWDHFYKNWPLINPSHSHQSSSCTANRTALRLHGALWVQLAIMPFYWILLLLL